MDFNPERLQRFFKGKYSRADCLTSEKFFTDITRRGELKGILQNHWAEINREPLPEGNIDHMLHRIHHQIHLEERSGRRQGFIAGFQRVAAILIIPLILGFFAVYYTQTNKNPDEAAMAEIQCPLGVRTKFVLPDGTTGFLNSGSTLEYPVRFTRERNVTLNGEAYFDVAPDKERSFTVTTPHLGTRVLGTQFNVIAYQNENIEEIILKEGVIEVFSHRGKKLETLQPNQKLDLDILTKRYSKSQVEAHQYVSWTEGKLVFRNESLQQVANRLGRWYNVEIEIQDPELLKYALWATFIDEPLEEVLKLLALTAPLCYEEQIRETTEDNIYKKRKVIIRLDETRLDAF